MTCPFANRALVPNIPLSDLPVINLETFRSMGAAHIDKVRLMIFDSYVFDVSTDSSFLTAPLSEAVNTDTTDLIMSLQNHNNSMGENVAYAELDEFSKMRARSTMLRLFCEKYKPLAKIE